MATKGELDATWEAVRAGKHAVLLGEPTVTLPDDWSPLVVRVACDGVGDGPLPEARRTIARLLGDPELDATGALALRRRLFGDLGEGPSPEGFAELGNRLVQESQRGALLVLDQADAAGERTLMQIRRLLAPQGRMRLPLVMGFASSAPSGAAALLADTVASSGGVVARREQEQRQRPDPSATALLRALPSPVLRVLRAAVGFGSSFDAREVAELLDEETIDVLEALQASADAGVALEDRGDMRMRVAPPFADALRASVLPSLARERARRASRPERPMHAVFAPPDVSSLASASNGVAHAAAPSASPRVDSEERPRPDGEAASDRTSAGPRLDPRTPSDERIAFEHVDERAEEELAGCRSAEAMGAYTQAVGAARRALALLDAAPPTSARRVLRIRALAAIGRLFWRGAGPEYDFSLPSALEALAQAEAALENGDPVVLRAELAVLVANVCYDLGDMRSLERAEERLSSASRALLESGDARGAARLLNDQAAVYVRMGDYVRAVHLLEQSRAVFAERADSDPVALREMAETDHLLARLPLHAPPRPGREEEALAAALRSARSAEGAYRRFRSTRELARVWETTGRLETRAGNFSAALEHLRAAAQAQQAAGNAVGLARTTAAMSDALAAKGAPNEAAVLLGDSVRLNLAKGSPLGLALNRRSLDALAAAGGPDAGPLRDVASALEAAERMVGRIHLPGEAG